MPADDPGTKVAIERLIQEVEAATQVVGFELDYILQQESKHLINVVYAKAMGPEKEEARTRLGHELKEIVQREQSLDPRSLALLIMWSFLAGFSEKLVPNLLAKTEGSINKTDPLSPE